MKFNEIKTEEKVRLDPKCWTGKKIGNPKTKVKGGVRVNNCVPAESVEQGVAEGSGDKVHLKTPKHGLADHPGRDTGVGLRTFAATPEQDRCPKCNSLFKNHYQKEGVAEGDDHSLRKVWDRYSKHLQAGRGNHPDVRQINKSGDILINIRKYVKDRYGQKAVDDMERYAEKKQWDESVSEGYNAEYNDEAGMADNNLETLERAVAGIDDLIQTGDNLPEWCQEKIAVAKSMLVAVWDYMESEEDSEEVDPEIDEMFEAMESLAEELAQEDQVSVDQVWETLERLDDQILFETAAWRRKAGKSAKGGLNAKGVASYRRENPGSKLQMAVTTKPSKLKPGSKAAKRRKSFCARMSGVKGPMKKPNGKPTRKALALRKWNC